MLARRLAFGFLAAALGLAATTTAQAGLTLGLDTGTNGAFPVKIDNSQPALSAIFDDVSLGTVNLTLDATNLVASEFVVNWLFNTTGIDATTLTITPMAPINAVADSISKSATKSLNGAPQIQAGLFNIAFDFPTSNSNPDRLAGGETQKYQITGTGLTSANFLSLSAGSNGGWFSAARIQGIPGQVGSGSIAGNTVTVVPEPGTVISAGLGVLGLAVLRLRRRRAA
jgi:MYXO-CTERM domain-containing protein